MAELLSRSGEYFTSGKCNGLLFDMGPYPVLTLNTAEGQYVIGDVFLLHNEHEVLTILDEYEGVGENLETGITYERLKVSIESEEGVKLSAWIYLHLGSLDHMTPIEGGDYLQYITESR
jgi:gamma-glutamylcyclotransferase (GGCT)/AIG2-like uncharacterized protein YtfP|tara:strand:- start:43078 stop:43434 length:357 start_codon:yes stop_codon:yes gene_type:complete